MVSVHDHTKRNLNSVFLWFLYSYLWNLRNFKVLHRRDSLQFVSLFHLEAITIYKSFSNLHRWSLFVPSVREWLTCVCGYLLTTRGVAKQVNCKSQRRYGDSTTCSRAGVTPRRVAWRRSANFLSREPRRGETGLWTPRRRQCQCVQWSRRTVDHGLSDVHRHTVPPYHLAVIRNTVSPQCYLCQCQLSVCVLFILRSGTPPTVQAQVRYTTYFPSTSGVAFLVFAFYR